MIQVHARCYGELEPLNGVLWLCNLCRPEAPRVSPRCCLCPVTGIESCCSFLHNKAINLCDDSLYLGGAMKPTTDGRWAHLACAIWIPGIMTFIDPHILVMFCQDMLLIILILTLVQKLA